MKVKKTRSILFN